MQAKKLINLYTDIDIDIVGITLLSKEEYLEFKKNIKPFNDWWWLRSSGHVSNCASNVGSDGFINSFRVDDAYVSIRPVLIYKSDNLLIGDTVTLVGKSWTVVSDKYILCNEKLCRMQFRRDYISDNANSYELSDIKKFLDTWFDYNIKPEELNLIGVI